MLETEMKRVQIRVVRCGEDRNTFDIDEVMELVYLIEEMAKCAETKDEQLLCKLQQCLEDCSREMEDE